MNYMFDEHYIKSEPTELTLENSILKYSNSMENRKKLGNCSILMLPIENFRQQAPLSFFEGFRNLYIYLREKLGKEKFDLCIDKENIQELALHSDEFRLGIFILESFLAPVLVGLLVEYLKNILFAKNEDTVSVDLILSNKKEIEKGSIKISYKGSTNDMEKKILDQIILYDKNGIKNIYPESHRIDVLS